MDAQLRRALRVLRLVHELHKQGYQLLRICPGMSPSGCHWRCAVTPRTNILETHGAMLVNDDVLTARYTSGQDNEYFSWTDAKHDTVQQLAEKFVVRFGEICRASKGDDWTYAGWYVRMLGFAEQEMLPISYFDLYEPTRAGFLPVLGREYESELPMPPPGEARDRR